MAERDGLETEYERLERKTLAKPEYFLAWLREQIGDPPSRKKLGELAHRKIRRVPLAVREVEEVAYWPGVMLTVARLFGEDIAACICDEWQDPEHVPIVGARDTGLLWSLMILTRRYCPVLWTRFRQQHWRDVMARVMEIDPGEALNVRPWKLHRSHRLRDLVACYGLEYVARLTGFPEDRLQAILDGEPVDAAEGWRLGMLSRIMPLDPALLALQTREMRQADSTTGGI